MYIAICSWLFFFKLAEYEGKTFFSSKRHLINSASVENVEAFPGAASVEHKITLHECPYIPSSDTFNFLRVLVGKHEEKWQPERLSHRS